MPHPPRHHLHYFTRIIIALLILFFGGILGYMILEGWSFFDSFYMVVITLATVGYGEVHELSLVGRIFTSFLIIFGIGFLTYTIAIGINYLIEGHLQRLLTKRYMQKRINQLQDHVIICGLGSTGAQIAYEFSRLKIGFCIIEKDEEKQEIALKEDWPIIIGDGSDEEVLKTAGIERASSLISVVGDDANDVFIILTARALSPNIFIVTHAETEESIPKLKQAGANRVSLSHKISGYHMATMATHPTVTDFINLLADSENNSFHVEEIEIKPDYSVIGKPVNTYFDVDKNGVSVLAIFKLSGEAIPSPDQSRLFESGDRLILMGTRENLNEAISKLEEKIA